MAQSQDSPEFRLFPIPADGRPEVPDALLSPEILATLEATRGLYSEAGHRPPWISYLSLSGDVIVGGGAFVGTPNDGAVEIAYFTFPDHGGRGHARRTAAALRDIAWGADRSVALVAKTMPREGPSTRILCAMGFRRVGDVEDHEIGTAWSWRLDPP